MFGMGAQFSGVDRLGRPIYAFQCILFATSEGEGREYHSWGTCCMPGMMLGAIPSFSHLRLVANQRLISQRNLRHQCISGLHTLQGALFCLVFIGLALVSLLYRAYFDHSFSKIVKSSVLFPLNLQHSYSAEPIFSHSSIEDIVISHQEQRSKNFFKVSIIMKLIFWKRDKQSSK